LIQIATAARNAARNLEQAGQGTLTDVLLLEIEMQRAQIGTTNAETVLQGQREQLAAIIGLPNFVIGDVIGELRTPPPDFNEEQLRYIVATQNTNVRIAQVEINRTQLALRRAEVEPFPNIYTGPAYAWGLQGGTGQVWYNFQCNIPIWNLNQGNIRAARANVRNATASVASVRNDLLRQTAAAYARYQASRDLAKRIADDILPTAVRTQKLVQDGYQNGEFDVAKYLQAQRSLREIELTYIDTLESLWTSAVELAGLLQVPQFP
jgi:outer membrane protein, heavy metal efflux system